MPAPVPARSPRGFTLVEILVVITIIASLLAIVSSVIPASIDKNKRLLCANNLRTMGALLTARQVDRALGGKGGPGLLLRLYGEGGIRGGDEKVFLCPGDPRGQNGEDPKFAARYADADPDHPDPLLLSYAVRDLKRYPVSGASAKKEILAACCGGEDGRTLHHRGGLNALYDDGSVLFLDREALGLRGDDPVVVGPDSAHEGLRKLLPPGK